MKPWGKVLTFIALFLLASTCAALYADRDEVVPLTPFMRQVEPAAASAGDTVTITGEALGKASVEAVYLSDGKTDYPARILEQTDKQIRIRVPEAPAGRMSLVVLVAGTEDKYIEQPVWLTVR
ncbi:MAG: IPT/TIG domain-containing protein [Bryobacterales bacterium]|jgi:hypothetical protein|nr:IPT/TIG domain-containing protein [Bryobacterales bacterium]